MTERQHYALMLSGGGARAAYQVGVMKALTQCLPRNHQIPFPILCGTSAGAINAAAMACYASCYHLGVRKLEWVWRNFTTSQVYDCSFSATFRYILGNYFSSYRSEISPRHASSLLNNQPLRHLIKQTLNFSRLDRNILNGHLRSLSITASSYTRRDCVSFYQGVDEIENWNRHRRRGKATTLEVEHLMASSAIPLVFPTVRIGDEYLGDGAIHQFSPLSTPIHLGARKILVIGVDKEVNDSAFQVDKQYPNSATIAGHLLDTVFADTLDADLERLLRVNQTLSIFNKKQQEQTTLKKIDCMVISPSQSIKELAQKHYGLLPSGVKALFKLLGVSARSDSSLLSYLLFEGPFCQELIQLGYKDGQERIEELQEFLSI